MGISLLPAYAYAQSHANSTLTRVALCVMYPRVKRHATLPSRPRVLPKPRIYSRTVEPIVIQRPRIKPGVRPDMITGYNRRIRKIHRGPRRSPPPSLRGLRA